MAANLSHHYTLEEYFALERVGEARYEYWDGEILCMSGGSERHYTISDNLYLKLSRLSRSKNCTVDCLVCGCLCETKHSADNAPLVKGLVPGPWLKTEGLPQTRPLYGTCRDATDSGSISGKFGSTETTGRPELSRF
jgi:hypothetical protein